MHLRVNPKAHGPRFRALGGESESGVNHCLILRLPCLDDQRVRSQTHRDPSAGAPLEANMEAKVIARVGISIT